MKKLIVLMAALSLVACSKNDNDSKPAGILARKPIIQKEALTESQRQEISQISQKAALMPDLTLLLNADDESRESLIKKSDKMKKMKPEAKEVLDAVKKNCDIQQPQKTKSGDTESPGSREISDTVSKISGDDCAVEYTETAHQELTAIESNLKSLKEEYQATSKADVFQKYRSILDLDLTTSKNQKILSPELLERTGIKDDSSLFKMKGQYTIAGSKITALSIKMKGQLTRTTLAGQKLIADVEMEMAQAGERKETYAEITFQYPSSTPTLQFFIDQNGKTDIHLNGQPITQEEMTKLFGDNMNVSVD